MIQIIPQLPDSSRRNFRQLECAAAERSFFKDLRQPFVEPHRKVGSDRGEGELMKRLVLQGSTQRIAPLAFEEGSENVLARHEDPAGIRRPPAGELVVIRSILEEIHLESR